MSDKQKLFAEKNKLFSEKNRSFAEKNKVFAEPISGILIPQEIISSLDSLIRYKIDIEQNHKFEVTEDTINEAIANRKRVLSYLTPLISGMCSAGLFDFVVQDRRFLKKKFNSVNFEAAGAFLEDLGITFYSEEFSETAIGIPSRRDDGHPNIGYADFYDYSKEVHRLAPGPKKPYREWISENEASVRVRYDEYVEDFGKREANDIDLAEEAASRAEKAH